MREFEPRHGWKVRRDAVLAPEQVAAIHEVLERWRVGSLEEKRSALLFRFLLRLPLRISEALALRKRDIAAGGGPGGAFARVTRLKKRRRNVIDELPLPEDLQVEILAWAQGLPRETSALFFVAAPGDRALSRHAAGRDWRACCKAAGVKLPAHCAVHITRHTAATAILRRTKNLRLVQELLGHESVMTTAGYTHVAFDEERAAISGLWAKEGSDV